MARYVVTGGCGFIGSHLADRLVNAGHLVTIVDNLSTGKLSNKPGAASLDATGPVVGRVEVDDVWFRYPAPAEVSVASLEADGGGSANGMRR